MTLLAWATFDIITARSANNKGIRKGNETEIANIASADREAGDMFWNTSNGTFGLPQVQIFPSPDNRGNLIVPLGADANEVSITSVTPTQVKDIGFIKDSKGFSCNQITIIARLKQTDGGVTKLIMEVDGGPTDQITLTENSASYVVNVGVYNATGLADGYHTLEFYLSNSTDTGDLELLEIWGI